MKLHHKHVLWSLLIGYALLLSYWMLWGFGRTAQPEYSYNLVPFATILSYFPMHSMTSLVNIVGNVAVFVPFGVLIPLAIRVNYAKMLGCFLSGLLLLEFAQFLTKRGSLDVDDFILNTVGVTIGYGLQRMMLTMKNGQPE